MTGAINLGIIGAGRIQQVTCAALQILYKVGARKGITGKDGEYSVMFTMNKRTKVTDIRISFKFNDQPVRMSIEEGRGQSTLTLYIVD